jgi:hypothetical protein
MQFAANLIRLRKAAGLSQEQLAFAAELHRTEIGQLERPTAWPGSTPSSSSPALSMRSPARFLDGMVWTPGEPARGRFGGRYAVDDG